MKARELIKWLLLACLVFTLPLSAGESTAGEPTAREPTAGEPTAGEPISLDALILYSPAVSSLYNNAPEARLEHLIEVANEAFGNSQLNVNLNARMIQEYPFPDEATPTTILATALQSEEIKSLRDELGADIVLIYRPYMDGQGCGSAFIAGEESREHLAFAHIAIDCATSSTPHEVGHLLGLGHSHRQGSAGIKEYANGYGVDSVFTTIMAYPTSFQNAPRLLTFSSPDLVCVGLPCGVPADETQPADAVLAIQQTAPVVAAYRDKVTEPEIEPEAVIPLTPVEAAKETYESFIPVYEVAQQQFSLLRDELLASYSETTRAFLGYISARRQLLVLQQTDTTTSDEIATIESAIGLQKQRYEKATARRNLALDSYVTGFYEVLVPAIRTLASLRLTYEEELAKVNPPPEPD